MPNNFVQSAINWGGSGDEFNQSIAIQAAGWGSKNPKNRGGAWTGGNGLEGGVCQGLVLLYIGSNGNWQNFLTRFTSPSGMAMVRGAMNLSKEADRTGAFGTGAQMWNNFVDHLSLFGKAFGASYSGQRRFAENDMAAEGVEGFVPLTDGIYHLLIYFSGGGHSIAYQSRGGSFKIFDPNYGEVQLPDKAALLAVNQWLLGNFYAGISRWILMRYIL
ncbi:YopT-type cysteine protease domain-containing protein [Acidicapsa dinghuensis]|uniref:YopT-type cysteine protease domain-containing protein n=1 Tax=Acidicapsa dinghuensis TaxID=2218256 RepID=A0ABW1EFQ9_9BACT|nr:YopT-type cysteine protease domain-containing protein [Acidicapsa dinghuensis]